MPQGYLTLKHLEVSMAKILDGVRIIDFASGQLGNYGTMLLADFGAEVIKIERG